MNIRNWRNFLVALVCVAAAWAAPSAQAMLMGGTFSNVGFSGNFIFDTSMVFEVDGSFSDWTLTGITEFNASYDDGDMTQSWTLDDLISSTNGIATANANGDSTYLVLATDPDGKHGILSFTSVYGLDPGQLLNTAGYQLTVAGSVESCSISASPACWVETRYFIQNGIEVAGNYYVNVNVPEPTTLALLSLGLVGLGFTRRRMKA